MNIMGKLAAILFTSSTLFFSFIVHAESGPNEGHWAYYPLMDGGFQPELSLQDYNTRCEVLRSILETCAYDLQNKKFTDFYECP